MTYRHIVLFRIHEEITNLRVDEAIRQLESLVVQPGVASMYVARSLDGRKGRIIVEDATFDDANAFMVFRASQAHVAVAAEMAEISDWWVGDYERDLGP